jgi:hypothetical protein
MQDRCTVCTEHTIGLKIILDASDETPRSRGSYGIVFRSVWRQRYCRYNIGARFAQSTIGSEIVLDAPDGTPW